MYNKVALHQVESLLIVEQYKMNKAKEKAISEHKIDSEIEMWGDMATIYGILLKKLKEIENPTQKDEV